MALGSKMDTGFFVQQKISDAMSCGVSTMGPNRAALCVDTVRSTIELTRVGTWQERVALAQKLNAQFDIAPEHREGQLPTGWCEVSSPERENILVRRIPNARRKQAVFAWTICIILSSTTAYVLGSPTVSPNPTSLLIFLVTISGLAAWGALWLSMGRVEWLLEARHLAMQKRFGQNRTKKFDATALELI